MGENKRRIRCPHCGSNATLQKAKEIDKKYKNKMAYICENEDCKAYAFADSEGNMQGIMADKELRVLRKEANRKIDMVMQAFNEEFPTRQEINKWLSVNLYLKSLPDKHLSGFSRIMCNQTIKLCNKKMKEKNLVDNRNKK